ncbi:glycosyltransferase family 2 protein [Stieleria maiorica]|uniref:glycosyltransferase family 2 protein n=1 Tax=Stieleria maiorica TaxID=2795974 RepID=UPI00142F32F4|nr:glycosyltransferase family 2 protein [Stieleria maiorica]
MSGSLVGLFYAYLGYPLLIAVLARVFGRDESPVAAARRQDLPEVTVLIAAHNAANYLTERIENILACDYPPERLNILVASDGSTDQTGRVVSEFNDSRIKVISFKTRRGKAATLIDAVGSVASPVVIFTDATTRFDKHSVRRLARHFADRHVGLVAGKVTMIDEHGSASESLYWKLENKIRACEARLGITLGASGAIYAISRSMFVAPSRPTINDDMVLPMLVRMTHPCRLVFDPTAQAYSSSTGGIRAEFSRRQRIGLGAMQCLAVLRGLLRWKNRGQAAAFVSHKLLRWAGPFLLIAAFVSNLCLATTPIYQTLVVLQVLAYVAAGYGVVASGRSLAARLARAATSFVVMNAAIGVGICRWLAGHDTVIWNPTQRPSWSHIPATSEMVPTTEKRAA